MNIYKTYDNGFKMVHECVPTVKSVAVGVYVNTGCIYENSKNNGISHFLEHMVFKGTEHRTAKQITEEMDNIGANNNAFTSKTNTAFYTISMADDIEKCMDVLSDLVFFPTFPEEELKKEKGVVCEEIDMVEDDAEDLVIERAASEYFKGCPLSKSILGPKKNVMAFTREDLINYMSEHYVAQNMLISIVGNVDFDRADALVQKYFIQNFENRKYKNPHLSVSDPKSTELVKFKKIEQANIALLFRGVPFLDEDFNAQSILNTMFGSSMSGRLYQRIREQMGLAYSVYSYPSSYVNDGYFGIYIGTNKNVIDAAVQAVKQEIDKVLLEGFAEEEFMRGKAQMKTAFAFSQESMSSLMRTYAKYLSCGKTFDFDKRLEEIQNVTLDDVKRVAARIFDYSKVIVSYVGPKTEVDLLKYFKEN